jgi:hypothetical protein
MGLLVDTVALRQLLSKYFGFPCQGRGRTCRPGEELHTGSCSIIACCELQRTVDTWEQLRVILCRVSSVSTVPSLRTERSTNRDWISCMSEHFSLFRSAQTGSGAHLTSNPIDTGRHFPLGVKRSGRQTDHSHPASADVKNFGAIPPLPYTSIYSWRGA